MSARVRFRTGLSVIEGTRRDTSALVAGSVARNVRELRKSAGYSLDVLSQKAGVSRAMLGQIETAKSVPTITVLWRIAEALNVEVSALISPSRASSIRPIDAPAHVDSNIPGIATRELSGSLSDARGAVVEVVIAAGRSFLLGQSPSISETLVVVVRGEIRVQTVDADEVILAERSAVAIQPRAEAHLVNTSDEPATIHLFRTARLARL